jgi:hypothetical protein
VKGSPLWQKIIWTVMFLLVYEGALRKWVLPGLQSEIFFLKDVLLLLAYGFFLVSRTPPGTHLRAAVPLKEIIVASLAYFSIELINPDSPSILVSILGMKSYLLYVPLAFIVPYMFSSSEDLERKLHKYAILMIPCVALGLVQFSLPPTHWINGYLNNHDPDSLVMGAVFDGEINKVRSIGTFSYIGGFAGFLTVMFYLVAGLVAKNRWKISGNLWLFGYLVLTVATMFTTGSRAPIWWLIATWPLAMYIWRYAGLLSMQTSAKMIMAVATVWVLAQLLAADAFDAYSLRAEHATDAMSRVLSPLTQTLGAVQVSGLLGTGMGSTNGGALGLMHSEEFWWLNGNFFEVEMARVVQETGIVGFILVYAARVLLMVKAISLGKRFRNPLYASLSAVIACLFLQDVALGFVVNNATVGIYHWFAAGLLFAMYRLDVIEAARMRGASVPDRGRVARYSKVNA